MKRFLLLLTLAALTWGLTAQIHRSFEPPTRHGRGLATALGLPANPAALYTFGPDGSLVPGARWFQPGWNLLRWSETFDNSAWLKVRTTVNASGTSPRGATAWALAATTDGQSHRVQQSFSGDPGVVYTLSCDVKAADKSVAYLVSEATSPTDSNTTYFDLTNGEVLTSGSNHSNPTISPLGDGWYRISVSFTGSDTECCVHVAFAEADGDPEWTGDGTTIDGYATAMQLEPGTSLSAYQKTEAQQTFHDWSGNGFDAVRGSTENVDTNDPQSTPSSRNLLAPGSTEDFEHTAWNSSKVTVTANYDGVADLLVGTGGGYIHQTVSVIPGASYTFQFAAKKHGTCTIAQYSVFDLTHTADIIPTTNYADTLSSDSYTTVTVPFTVPEGCDSVSTYVLRGSAAGQTSVLVKNVQLETGSTATAYTNPAEESLVQGATFDGTDDYVATRLTVAGNRAIVALVRKDGPTAPDFQIVAGR